MIIANCRERFTARDFDFVVGALSTSAREQVSLVELLTDADARDAVLDDPRLIEAVATGTGTLAISPQCYFYVLTRHALKQTAGASRAVCDYVASLLDHFSSVQRMRSPADGHAAPIQYVSDMVGALRDAPPRQEFLIRAHIGNYALFLTGVFLEAVRRRSLRGGPGVEFYERMGEASFHTLAGHRLARSSELADIFATLADGFHEIRLALNRLADRILHLDASAAPLGLAL